MGRNLGLPAREVSPPVLFLGESWLGSCGRSFREALVRQGLRVEDYVEESAFPKWRPRALRAVLRLVRPATVRAYEADVLARARSCGARIVMAYKGARLSPNVLARLRDGGCRTVNIYPDYSPLNQGMNLVRALGDYDLVVSTKVWHPGAWAPMFGYSNRCRYVPQGYDPVLHYRATNSGERPLDVAMVATYREEYARLVVQLAEQPGMAPLKVGLFGYGWERLTSDLPASWTAGGEVHGHAYVRALALAKVYIAPVTRDVVIAGTRYPGDEDSTRTYELPAAGAFFIHRRTELVRALFDEGTEVPMYDDGVELAALIAEALANPARREAMRAAAQARAVPRDSLDNRARAFLDILREEGILDD